MTVSDALRWAAGRLQDAGVDAPMLDAEVLLAHTLGWERSTLLTHSERTLSAPEAAQFRTMVERRAGREPLAYIVGHKEFYGLELWVDRRVLIPRPETEELVELALAWLRAKSSGAMRSGGARSEASSDAERAASGGPFASEDANSSDAERVASGGPFASEDANSAACSAACAIVVADVGTGSGAIAVALAHTLPALRVYAADASADALDVARRNVERYGLGERVSLLAGDLLEPLPMQIDLIVANLPYIAAGEVATLMPEVRCHEPCLALDGGADGFDLVRRLLSQAQTWLRAGGALLLEIGASQGAAAQSAASAAFPQSQVGVQRDLAGLERILVVQT